MDQSEPVRESSLPQLMRIAQSCDSDCAYFEMLAALPEWGWCHDPACPFHQGLVRPGRERSCYAPRPAGSGR